MEKKIYTAFNTYFNEFLTKLLIIIPDNEQIKTAKNTFHLGKRMNPEIYIKFFYKHITSKFHEKILSKDDKFFLEYDFSLLPIENVNVNIEHTHIFKNIWKDKINSEHKDIIWNYIKVLSCLALKYNNSKL